MKKAPCYVGITGGGLLCLSLGGDCNAVSGGSGGLTCKFSSSVSGGDGDNLRRFEGEIAKYYNHLASFRWGWVRSHEATEHFGRAGELTVPHEQINLPRGWVPSKEVTEYCDRAGELTVPHEQINLLHCWVRFDEHIDQLRRER